MRSGRNDHGGDIYSLKGVNDITDLSSNINPMEIPDRIYDGLKGMLDKAKAYPDIEYRSLIREIILYLERLTDSGKGTFTEEMTALGNGASDITDRIISLFDRAVIPVPSFTEYMASCRRYNKEAVSINVYEERVTEGNIGTFRGRSFFERVCKEMDERSLLILTNPNNPDGQLYDKGEFIKYLETAERRGWYTLVDETFAEFSGKEFMMLDLVPEFRNLIVIKAVTKFFGLPGIRLGYAVSGNTEILRKADDLSIPWSIGTFDENIAVLMMNDEEYIRRSAEENIRNRKYLTDRLRSTGLFSDVYGSDSDFLMVRLKESSGTSKEAAEFLKRHGILIRTLCDMKGLSPYHARIAVKKKGSTDRLIHALIEYSEFLSKT